MKDSLFSHLPQPPRLPNVVIPVAARKEIIDYFAALATQHDQHSYEGSRIQAVLRTLNVAEDPIEELLSLDRMQRLPYQKQMNEQYAVGLEMLYSLRHRLEAEWLATQEGDR
jgi:hypothetical protein